MHFRIVLAIVSLALVSCGTKKATQSNSTASPHQRNQSGAAKSRYLEDISTQTTSSNDYIRPSLSNESKNIPALSIEMSFPAQFKYAILLDVAVEEMNNRKMLNFLEEWWGTRYKYGGDGKDGIDCSAFTKRFVSAIYQKEIPRTSAQQYQALVKIKKKDLKEGDLVFFNTQRRKGAITHVGVYLKNNKFVHASTSSGVIISDLDDFYFSKRYVGAGRL
jgi:cell wall-associated NlpC family hydrolase